MDKDLYKLEVLSLVQRVAQEIFNFTSRSRSSARRSLVDRLLIGLGHSLPRLACAAINDKALAEFVISLHGQSKGDVAVFKKKLDDIGAGFQESFIENLK